MNHSTSLPARTGQLDTTQALWLQGLILLGFLAASSVPSPLYALYRESWNFSAFTLTVVFASYAIALLAALLVFGPLSDHRGRRQVLLGALVLEICAMVLFWEADSVGWLLAARTLQGVATGIATSAIGAGLLDLNRERGSLINSIAPMVGLGAGALLASALVQFAAAPTRLVFELLLLVFVAQFVAAWYLPETVARRPGAWASMVPSIRIPAQAGRTFLQVLPVTTAQWAVAGLYFSLGPTLARVATGNSAPLVGGILLAALTFTSAVTLALVRTVRPRLVLEAGTVALALGMPVTLAGIHLQETWAFLAGSLITGAGFGAAFSGSIRSLVPLAAPHERAGLMSSFFAVSYLAFSVPAIAAGLLADRFGLQATAIGYGLGVVGLAITALLLIRYFPQPTHEKN